MQTHFWIHLSYFGAEYLLRRSLVNKASKPQDIRGKLFHKGEKIENILQLPRVIPYHEFFNWQQAHYKCVYYKEYLECMVCCNNIPSYTQTLIEMWTSHGIISICVELNYFKFTALYWFCCGNLLIDFRTDVCNRFFIAIQQIQK
jgi:hypothetical protein